MKTNIQRDRRDSLATKIGASLLTGVLSFGLGKLSYDLKQETTAQNCLEYGFLKGQPAEVQRQYIRGKLNEKSWLFRSNLGLRPDIKDWSVDLILESLENCKPQPNTK
ncbi:MAG: hypothetical protein AABX79_02090 [Nanoarchaeota archaeon]